MIPDSPGIWADAQGEEIDVYELEPVGGTLCVWGPEVGMSYNGATETQMVWSTDE